MPVRLTVFARRVRTALQVLRGIGGLVCEDCGTLRVYSNGNYSFCCHRCNDCGQLRAAATCRHWRPDGSEA
jgi:hypothetical protein